MTNPISTTPGFVGGLVTGHIRPSSTDLSDSQLQTLCAALGWQGGTYWQVVDEVRRLKTIVDGVGIPDGGRDAGT